MPKTRSSLNGGGLYVTGDDHGEYFAREAQQTQAAAGAADAREKSKWDKHRKDVEKAEAALEEKGGDLKALLAMTGGVGLTKSIVLSRTGHHPKQKNKPAKPGEESALLLEARAAVAKSTRSLCPPCEEDDVTAGLTREDGAEAQEDEFEEEGEEEDAA